MNRKFLNLSKDEEPISAMLHLKETNDKDVVRRFKEETAVYAGSGVDYIVVESYFEDYRHTEVALGYISKLNLVIPYDVDCLNADPIGFELTEKYGINFVRLDSVVGRIEPRDEATLDAFFKLYRERCQRAVLGSVRFKYQPVLSQNSIEENLQVAMQRCDAICITQDATGQETSFDKIIQFRNGIGDFPLIVGTSVTPENMAKQFAHVDSTIVGSYFKDNYGDEGEVSQEHVREIVKAAQEVGGK